MPPQVLDSSQWANPERGAASPAPTDGPPAGRSGDPVASLVLPSGQEIVCGPQPLTIGRSAQADFRLNDDTVSRLHARLAVVQGRPTIEDLNSGNGTFLNGTRIREIQVLRDGDQITIGSAVLTVRLPAAPAAPPARGSAPPTPVANVVMPPPPPPPDVPVQRVPRPPTGPTVPPERGAPPPAAAARPAMPAAPQQAVPPAVPPPPQQAIPPPPAAAPRPAVPPAVPPAPAQSAPPPSAASGPPAPLPAGAPPAAPVVVPPRFEGEHAPRAGAAPSDVARHRRFELPRGLAAAELVPLGALSIETADVFRQTAEGLLEQGVTRWLIDLVDLDHLDSTGLAALLQLCREVRAQEGQVWLYNPSPAVRSIFELTRLDRVLHIVSSRDEALAKAQEQ